MVLKPEKGVGIRLSPPRDVCKCVRTSRGELCNRCCRSLSPDIIFTHIDPFFSRSESWGNTGALNTSKETQNFRDFTLENVDVNQRFSISILKSRDHTLDLFASHMAPH